ncbi:MAG: PAS domain S-box protein, partial [Spirochaetota bacterium]
VIGFTSPELGIFCNIDDRNMMVNVLKTTGRVNGMEMELASKTGTRYICLFFGEIIEVAGRKVLLTTVLDITKQRHAEEQLRKSEERFRRLAENAPDVIFRLSLPQRTFEFISRSSSSVLGYTPAEFYSQPELFSEIIHPEWKHYFSLAWDALLQGNLLPFHEYKIITKDGHEKWVYQRTVILRDGHGQPVAAEGIITDLTEKKNAENELMVKNAILAAEQDVSLDGILIVDTKGKILLANKNFVELWNIPAALIENGDDRELLTCIINRVADQNKFMRKVEYLYSHAEEKSNDEITLSDGRCIDRYSAPVISPKGEYIGRVWYFRDISPRKESEKMLKKANEELIAANEELTASNEEFEAINEELNESYHDLEAAQNQLKKSEEEYRSLIENLTSGLLIYDSVDHISLINPAAMRL